MKEKIFLIDTTVLLSGKPLYFPQATLIIPPTVASEIKPGGRDYRNFQLLKEKGLTIHQPTPRAQQHIKKAAQQTGDLPRLSPTDIDLLALACDLHNDSTKDVTILTDDYAIQNVAHHLHIPYLSVTERGISQHIQWISLCPGCKRHFTQPTTICPICGTKTRLTQKKKKQITPSS